MMFNKTYNVYMTGRFLIGTFATVESFVRDYYYTMDSHEDWMENMREIGQPLNDEDKNYENHVADILEDIRVYFMPDAPDGFEWGGYYFKEVR